MPEDHIDLDAPEPAGHAPPRPRRLLVFGAVGLLLAGIAAYGLARRPPEPPDTATLTPAAPLWTVDVDDELGEPLVAAFTADTVLVTAQRGLVAYDRATGTRRWRMPFGDLIGSPFDGRLNRDIAVDLAMVHGDAVLVDAQSLLETARPDHHVLDLATGRHRFTLGPTGDADWFTVRLTPAGLLSARCDLLACRFAAHDPTDGAERWHLTRAPGTEVIWPSPMVGWEHHDPESPHQPEETTVEGGAALLLLFASDAEEARVEAIRADTGERVGGWSAEVDIAYGYTIAGEAVLDPRPFRLSRIDPTDGGELWRTETLGELSPSWTSGVLLAGGGLLDSDRDGERTRLIDLADGSAGPEFTGEHPVVVRSGVGVTITDGIMAGTDLRTGTPLWRTVLRTSPWDAFRGRGVHADTSWLVVHGVLGIEQRSPRWIAAVDLSTGVVRGFTGASVVGYDGGQMLTVSFPWERPTAYTLRLERLG